MKKGNQEIKRENKKIGIKDRAKKTAREFREEFNKSIKTSFVAAFGFLLALVWRDFISEYLTKISSASPIQGKFISAGIITFVCIFGIFAVTKIFPEKKD